MPKHRIVVTVENSPRKEIEFPPLEQDDAQKIKNLLHSVKGKKIVEVRMERAD